MVNYVMHKSGNKIKYKENVAIQPNPGSRAEGSAIHQQRDLSGHQMAKKTWPCHYQLSPEKIITMI
jgi:hypothetical protein